MSKGKYPIIVKKPKVLLLLYITFLMFIIAFGFYTVYRSNSSLLIVIFLPTFLLVIIPIIYLIKWKVELFGDEIVIHGLIKERSYSFNSIYQVIEKYSFSDHNRCLTIVFEDGKKIRFLANCSNYFELKKEIARHVSVTAW